MTRSMCLDSTLNRNDGGDSLYSAAKNVTLDLADLADLAGQQKKKPASTRSKRKPASLNKTLPETRQHPMSKSRKLIDPGVRRISLRDPPTNEQALNSAVELSNWIIRPVRDCKGICVEGKRKGMFDFWHSTAIKEAKSRTHVTTAFGSEYFLKGEINVLCTLESGFTEDVAMAFSKGFPKNWEKVIKQFYDCLEKCNSDGEEIRLVKNQKHRKRRQPRKSKPILSEEDIDSVLTPVGLVKQSMCANMLTMTRSGRVSLPPLAHWTGQKYVWKNSEIMVDFETNDARRAIMEETLAIHNLSKSSQKMVECRHGASLKNIPASSKSNGKNMSPFAFSKSSKSIPDVQSKIDSKLCKPSTGKRHSNSSSVSRNNLSLAHKGINASVSSTRKEQKKNTRTLDLQAKERQFRHSSKDDSSKEKNHMNGERKSLSVKTKISNDEDDLRYGFSGIKSNTHKRKISIAKNDENKTEPFNHSPTKNITKERRILTRKKRSSAKGVENVQPSSLDISEQGNSVEHFSIILDKSPLREQVRRRSNRLRLKECSVVINRIEIPSDFHIKQGSGPTTETATKEGILKTRKQGSVSSKENSGGNSDGRNKRGRKRPRTPTSFTTPNFDEGSSTPKRTVERRVLKKRRLNTDCIGEKANVGGWSALEMSSLQRNLQSVDCVSNDCWGEVASRIKTKTSEECQQQYTVYLNDKTAGKPKNQRKSKKISGRSKGDPVCGRKGTMKRKKEIRAYLQEQNEDYGDNLCDGTPLARKKPLSSTIDRIAIDDDDEAFFGTNCSFFTPLPGQSKGISTNSSLRVPFASTKKTPVGLVIASDTPANPISKRDCADKYMYAFAENKKKSTVSENSLQAKELDDNSALIKSLFPVGDASIFGEKDKEKNDIHDDDDEEDNEKDNGYTYYWSDLECSD